tara:strand:+ start:1621 stop:1977 length:357 start_codon:yes stop_codon:yes gene_type:complete
MDKIRILNLKLMGRHGVYGFEKEHVKQFEVDIEMFKYLSVAGKSDNLEDTVDYNDVVTLVADIFSAKNYDLLEAVGESICNNLLSTYPIEKVVVRVRKPHAPIQAEFDTVEVELVRTC